jgi:DNA polymerase III sliding clamp (beta) subunit (PCNA family)
LGENISNINAQISGGVNNIIINYRYLLDGLQNINHDQIQLEIIDAGSPCVLRPAKKDGDYLYIIMPIKQ